MNFETINKRLLNNCIKEYGEEAVDAIFKQDMCDIDGSFLGFVHTYHYLSKIIPVDRIVIDIGCAYGFQAYYFRHHRKYIGVCPTNIVQLKTENSKYFQMTAQEFFKTEYKNIKTEREFGICSYVPDDEAREVMKKHMKDCFCYYPR